MYVPQVSSPDPRTTDAQWSIFSLKSRNFGLGRTNWVDPIVSKCKNIGF